MDSKSIRLRVPNGIFFITGSDIKGVPEITRGSCIWPTTECIAVGCTPDVDGETSISIGPLDYIRFANKPIFIGQLETPNHAIMVEIVPGKTILEQRVASDRTQLSVWVNHPREPDNVVIGWSNRPSG